MHACMVFQNSVIHAFLRVVSDTVSALQIKLVEASIGIE